MAKKNYCVICGKYRKFKNSIISYIFKKTLVLFSICSKCSNEDEKIFKGYLHYKTIPSKNVSSGDDTG